jgi:hypothetical protein
VGEDVRTAIVRGTVTFDNIYGTTVVDGYDLPIHTGIKPGELSAAITKLCKSLYFDLNNISAPADAKLADKKKAYMDSACNTSAKVKPKPSDNSGPESVSGSATSAEMPFYIYDSENGYVDESLNHIITEIGKQVNEYIHSERSEERVEDAKDALNAAERYAEYEGYGGAAAHTRRRSHRRRRRHRRRSAKHLRTDIR